MSEPKRRSRGPMVLAAVLGLVAALCTLVLLLRAAAGSMGTRCEVCVTYMGRTACREAVGPGEQEATRTATDNACAFLASGMTQVVECTTRTPPVSVTCQDR